MDVFGNERITLIDFTFVLFPGEERMSVFCCFGVSERFSAMLVTLQGVLT